MTPEPEARPAGDVLSLEDLRITYPGPPEVRAVDGLTLSVRPGECLAVLGESGSGKSTLARALLGVAGGRVEGAMSLGEVDFASLDEEGWRRLRWLRIAMAFQSTTSLDPVLRIGRQLTEPLRLRLGMDRSEADRRAGELLDEVGLGPWAASRFPSELSGGQRRLVLLAIALACDPEVLVLDEPTTGLDPVTRLRVLSLLSKLKESTGKTLVVLTHDVEAAETLADRVAVLYRGWLAEIGDASAVLGDPRNPYTWALLNARPTLASVKDLRGIRGDPPPPTQLASGCPFLGRCTQSVHECADGRPPLVTPLGERRGERFVSCIRGGTVPVVSARALYKTFKPRSRLVGGDVVHAVAGVDLEVREGETVGLVGTSGAGKSTIGMLVVGLLEPDAGIVELEGVDLHAARGKGLKGLRSRVQMLFQDPYEALSSRLTVGEAVREPLDVQGRGSMAERISSVRDTLASCRLPANEDFLDRRTHELSGGQLQRVALARALILGPKLLVADEPVSMLDPSEQAKVLQLLKQLQVERGMAMLFVSHDLSVVLRVADRVLVVDGGQIVEQGPGSRILIDPLHPVTQELLSAAGRDAMFPSTDVAGCP
jgi:peptide/nickel transport system ATP-binding protein